MQRVQSDPWEKYWHIFLIFLKIRIFSIIQRVFLLQTFCRSHINKIIASSPVAINSKPRLPAIFVKIDECSAFSMANMAGENTHTYKNDTLTQIPIYVGTDNNWEVICCSLGCRKRIFIQYYPPFQCFFVN